MARIRRMAGLWRAASTDLTTYSQQSLPNFSMFDQSHIGHVFPGFHTRIEAGKVALFCKALGETGTVHLDQTAARAAGYRDLLAPLTYPSAIAMECPNPNMLNDLLGFELRWMLHAEEEYEYGEPICVGDDISTAMQVTDLYEKKQGALKFAVCQLEMRNQHRQLVCKVRRSLVARMPA
jgi:acyl dehydratase